MSNTKRCSVLLAGLMAIAGAYAQTNTGAAAQANTSGTDASQTSTASAEHLSKDAAKAEHDRIKAAYKSDKDACKSMKGNAKDVCEAEAKAKEKVALAELKFKETGKDSDREKVAETKAKTDYDVAKERCEDKSGKDKSACKADAKAAEKSALANAKKGSS
jgi:hypothetical protein